MDDGATVEQTDRWMIDKLLVPRDYLNKFKSCLIPVLMNSLFLKIKSSMYLITAMFLMAKFLVCSTVNWILITRVLFLLVFACAMLHIF